VIEVKAVDEQTEYERNKREYGRDQSLFNTVFAKEVGFEDFRKHNKEFEYRVVFSTSLREWQKQLMEACKCLTDLTKMMMGGTNGLVFERSGS